ncbi:hypothetical protein D3C86_1446990 [compost metagenome]
MAIVIEIVIGKGRHVQHVETDTVLSQITAKATRVTENTFRRWRQVGQLAVLNQRIDFRELLFTFDDLTEQLAVG